MSKLKNQLQVLESKRDVVLKKIDLERSRQFIKCASCSKSHMIKSLDLVQTHWYTSPYGCTGGDYWNEGELQFICPVKSVRNRIMFDNYDVPWDKRSHYDYNPSKQFNRMYKHLFKSVTDEYEKDTTRHVNNDYVDHNRKKFGLVEKRSDSNE